MSNRSNKPRSTPSITLRSVRYSDAALLYTIENDPQTWQWSKDNEAPYSINEIEKFCLAMELSSGHPDPEGQLRLMIELQGNEIKQQEVCIEQQENKIKQHVADPTHSICQAIGTIDLYNCDVESRTAKVAILIYPEQHRAQGYGKVALQALIAAAHTLGFDTLTAEIDSKNNKSRNLFASCGFRLLNTTPNGIMQYILND